MGGWTVEGWVGKLGGWVDCGWTVGCGWVGWLRLVLRGRRSRASAVLAVLENARRQRWRYRPRPQATDTAAAAAVLQGWRMPPTSGNGRRGRIYYGTQVGGWVGGWMGLQVLAGPLPPISALFCS